MLPTANAVVSVADATGAPAQADRSGSLRPQGDRTSHQPDVQVPNKEAPTKSRREAGAVLAESREPYKNRNRNGAIARE